MNGWRTTDVIPCVGSNGEKVTIIAQIRDLQGHQPSYGAGLDDPASKPVLASDRGPDLRYVLGNGLQVDPLDTERFLLPKTQEIVIRR